MSFLPNVLQLKSAANYIKPGTSKAAVDHFMETLPQDLKPFRMRSSKKSRLELSDRRVLQGWFDRFKTVTDGVSPVNIYNFDETSFQIGDGNRPQWVFAFAGEPIPYATKDRIYSEWITTVECVVADGWKADPFIIVQGEEIPEKWTKANKTPASTIFGINASGRITEEVTLEWIQFFDNQTKARVVDNQPRVLLFRSEPHHLAYPFLEHCDKNNIIPFCFPMKMSHLMQPFDQKFPPKYKDYWRSKHGAGAKDPEQEKENFFRNFCDSRSVDLDSDAIKGAFAGQGLSPFDPSKIFERLK